ncbi:MAG: hypothetical protein KF841_05035 [Phycisphaerae bacterium]|nr:hypothetical protein [Phycisphaerae bacterium]
MTRCSAIARSLFPHSIEIPAARGDGPSPNSLPDVVGALPEDGAATAETSLVDPLKNVTASAGVYLLTDESDRPILLAHAQNVRRAVAHRLAAPDPNERTKRANLSDVTRRLHWAETFSPFETHWVHYRAARAMYPASYGEMIGFAPAWFVRIDPSAPFPRFTATDRIRTDDARYFGPLAAMRDADEWIHMLEDAFDLCRYHNVLERAPNGERCAYFDMGKCPAPCDGSLSMDAYRDMIRGTIEFTGGRHDDRLAVLRNLMQQASDRLAFEKASTIRKVIERAEMTAARPEYAFMGDMATEARLVIQRASSPRRDERKSLLRPYFVAGGHLETGAAVSLASVAEHLPAWIESARQFRLVRRSAKSTAGVASARAEAVQRGELASLVAKFLFQGDKAAGVFLHVDRLPDAASLLELVRQRFSVAKAATAQTEN